MDTKPPSRERTKQDAGFGSMREVSLADSRRLRRKVDFVLLPLLGFCYFVQFLDKQTLSYASLLGMLEDTHLDGSKFSWTASIFYFGYIFWSYPTMFLSVRLPIGKYLAGTVLVIPPNHISVLATNNICRIVWATVLMCHAACHDFTGLMITRFFLGAFEASIAPGFSLIMGMWYTRREQPFRCGLWFACGALATLFGGLASYGVGHIEGDLAVWRYLFLIFGAVTGLWGTIIIVLLPDAPPKTFWLTDTQRETAVQHILADGQGGVKGSYKLSQVIEALRDPTNWFLSLYTFCVNIANGGLTAFGSLVVQGFGYEGLQALLIQMPSGAAQLGFVLLSCALCSWLPNIRTLTMIFLTLVSLVGMVLMYALDPVNQKGSMAGFCLCLAFSANMPLAMSLITSNVRGFTKRAVVNACVLVMYCVGNIAGPQFFRVDEASRYTRGIKASLAGFGLGAFWLMCLLAYLVRQNKKRAREADSKVPHEVLLMEDCTDWEIPGCEYVL